MGVMEEDPNMIKKNQTHFHVLFKQLGQVYGLWQVISIHKY